MAKGGYNYGKPVQNRVVSELMMGQGIVWAEGTHPYRKRWRSDSRSRRRRALPSAEDSHSGVHSIAAAHVYVAVPRKRGEGPYLIV